MKSSIDWIFISKGEPVEVIEEYDQWRLVKDIDGDGGWVHSSVLSSRRSVIVTGVNAVNMFKKPSENSQIVATVYPKVRCHLNKCLNSWCYVKCKTYEGWIINSNLWGIYTKDTSKVASKTSGEQGARTIRTIVRKQSSQLSHPSTLHF